MNRIDPGHDLRDAAVAAWPAAPAFDAKSIVFANDMDVREMRDAPSRAVGHGIERSEVGRLFHARIREVPDERCNRKVCGDQYDRVGERRENEAVQKKEIRHRGHPARGRPGNDCQQHAADA